MPKNFMVRLEDDEAEMIEQIAADRDTTRAAVLRDAVRLYTTGQAASMQGPDEGYIEGKRTAAQIAFELVRDALDRLPPTYDDARAWATERVTSRLQHGGKLR